MKVKGKCEILTAQHGGEWEGLTQVKALVTVPLTVQARLKGVSDQFILTANLCPRTVEALGLKWSSKFTVTFEFPKVKGKK